MDLPRSALVATFRRKIRFWAETGSALTRNGQERTRRGGAEWEKIREVIGVEGG